MLGKLVIQKKFGIVGNMLVSEETRAPHPRKFPTLRMSSIKSIGMSFRYFRHSFDIFVDQHLSTFLRHSFDFSETAGHHQVMGRLRELRGL